MKDILKILQSAEEQLLQVEKKLKEINTVVVIDDLAKKRESIIEKLATAKKSAISKRVELLDLLVSLRVFIPEDKKFGPYGDTRWCRDCSVFYRITEKKISITANYKGNMHMGSPSFEYFAEADEHFYLFFEHVINFVEQSLLKTSKDQENEHSRLTALREKLASLALQPA